jgi:hypothetical protein
LAFVGGPLLVFGAPDGLTQSNSGPHCRVAARGALANGDEFFGHATVNTDFRVSPPGLWRHRVPGSPGAPEAIFVGRIDDGICIRNGGTSIQLYGAGRYAGRAVEFDLFGRDGPTDSYLIMIRDTEGKIVYTARGDLTSGDISAAFP